jgi:acyl-CoA reductase-like NAD-dependent aldehyde dehydrogenase
MSPATIQTPTQLFVGGQFADAGGGETFTTFDPATGDPIANVAHAQAGDVDHAVRAAQASLDGTWGSMSLADRARVLRDAARLIESRVDELARLESLDGGKPIRECAGQVLGAAAWFDFFADIGLRLRSHVVPGLPGHLNYTLRQPVGVVGLIVAWNYPLVLAAIKSAAALGMGNAVLLKPAEQTPLTALALADVFREVGLPEGAFGVLTGEGETTGRAIVDHPGIGMVSFTGSTAVGREIAQRAGHGLKKVSLELGGKSPNVLFPDADLDVAVPTALWTFCVNQGQLCSAGTRLLVERSIEDEVLERLVRAAEDLRVGPPSDERTQLGAVISAEQLARIESYVEVGETEGAQLLTGGVRAEVEGHENGWFYRPTVFRGVDSPMRIAQEEIFGPVLSVIPFDDEAEAVALANDVMYGLACGIWTRDVSRVHRMAERVDAGMVYVNTMNQLAPGSPYSGWKQSGIGIEGGIEQAEGFSRLKTVWVNVDGEAPAL